MEGIDLQKAIRRARELQDDIQALWQRYHYPEQPVGVPGQSPEEVARLFQEFVQALIELDDLLTQFLGPEKEIEYRGERIRVRGPLPKGWREFTQSGGEYDYEMLDILDDLSERINVQGAIPPWWPRKRPPVP